MVASFVDSGLQTYLPRKLKKPAASIKVGLAECRPMYAPIGGCPKASQRLEVGTEAIGIDSECCKFGHEDSPPHLPFAKHHPFVGS